MPVTPVWRLPWLAFRVFKTLIILSDRPFEVVAERFNVTGNQPLLANRVNQRQARGTAYNTT
jgi:hypothetical protein